MIRVVWGIFFQTYSNINIGWAANVCWFPTSSYGSLTNVFLVTGGRMQSGLDPTSWKFWLSLKARCHQALLSHSKMLSKRQLQHFSSKQQRGCKVSHRFAWQPFEPTNIATPHFEWPWRAKLGCSQRRTWCSWSSRVAHPELFFWAMW